MGRVKEKRASLDREWGQRRGDQSRKWLPYGKKSYFIEKGPKERQVRRKSALMEKPSFFNREWHLKGKKSLLIEEGAKERQVTGKKELL